MAKRGKGRRREGRPSLLDGPPKVAPVDRIDAPKGRTFTDPPPPTSYDENGISLHCTTCGDIFNGPHKGMNIPNQGPEYRAVPDVSDTFACGKRSCVDKHIGETMAIMRGRNPDKDLDYFESDLREHAYRVRREDRDTYPGGFIDDVSASEASDE